MKTLIIVSHPDISGSSTQQFLLAANQTLENVTWHHLEKAYPDGKIDKQVEQELVAQHERIIFQFPLYWYSSPSLLKEWQDIVLDEKKISAWSGKEFGLVVIVGVSKKEYQAGGREGFTLDELMRPYQAVAGKFNWRYLPIFGIYQFSYMTEVCRQKLLVDYQQYLILGNQTSLNSRTEWFKEQLERIATDKDELTQNRLTMIVQQITDNQDEIETLNFTLNELE